MSKARSKSTAGPATAARRLRGLLLAVVLVASQTSAWLHAAAVSHVTCLEHGESIHAGASSSGGAANDLRRDVRTTEERGARSLRADLAVAPGHEHCGSGALLRWRDLALTAPLALAPVPVFSPPLPRDSAGALVLAAAIYRLAPKTSPPPAGV
jgi:hypothetical protein